MNQTSLSKKHMRSVAIRGCVLAICVVLGAIPATAAVIFDEISTRIVRVEVKAPGKDRVASGFIWQKSNQVVTSLHVVLDSSEIWVRCKQHRQKATILKVLKDADLVLLGTRPFPNNCQPFRSAVTSKPRNNQTLHTLGYFGASLAATARKFTKVYTEPPETIARIVGGNGSVVKDLRRLGTPSVDLEIYHVQGGLLPGYSGAPIVDEDGNLIAVVDGGLQQGQVDFNWAIPAKYLYDLVSSGTPGMPSTNANTASLFSYGFSNSEPNAVIEYREDRWSYHWVKTKTASLADIIRTSDSTDIDDIRELLSDYATVFGPNAEARLQFDIYEDVDNGLIIALPAGQGLKFESPQPGYQWLVSEAPPNGYDGHIQFRQLDWALPASTQRSAGQVSNVMPSDSGYFDAVIDDILRGCNKPGVSKCEMLPNSRDEYYYPGENKVLKVAFAVSEAGYPEQYDFYSFVVRGRDNIAFRVYARIHGREDDLFTCVDDPELEGCYNSAVAFTNLQQLLAVSLSSASRFYRPGPPMDLRME